MFDETGISQRMLIETGNPAVLSLDCILRIEPVSETCIKGNCHYMNMQHFKEFLELKKKLKELEENK